MKGKTFRLVALVASLLGMQLACGRSSAKATQFECPIPSTQQILDRSLAPLSIELHRYEEYSDGSLHFRVRVVNASEAWFQESEVRVALFDSNGGILEEEVGSCGHSIVQGGDCFIDFNIPPEKIPDGYAAYNLFITAIRDDGTTSDARLSDQPLIGQEGVLPFPRAEVSWHLPLGGYRAGDRVEARFDVGLERGLHSSGELCAQIIEFRRQRSGEVEPFTLADSCSQEVELTWLEGSEPYHLDLAFAPSGYTWVSQGDGKTPIGILACLKFNDQPVKPPSELFLPPVRAVDSWWIQGGERVETYLDGQPVRGVVSVQDLASEETPQEITVSVMQHPGDAAGLAVIFPPMLVCFTDLCDTIEASQSYQHTLVEGRQTDFWLEAQFQHETCPMPSREYYLALVINGEGVWRAEESIEQRCP